MDRFDFTSAKMFSTSIGTATMFSLVLVLPAIPQRNDRQQTVGGLDCSSGKTFSVTDWLSRHPEHADLGPLFGDDSVEVTPPEILERRIARYPDAALRGDYEATVIVQGIVEVDGSVKYAEAVDIRLRRYRWHTATTQPQWRPGRGVGPPLSKTEVEWSFRLYAAAHVKSLVFKPATRNSQSARMMFCTVVNYLLR